ncbi:hypothetical protein F7725_006003 [Dissostichus mawsoni]|uniref:Transmembrane protein n=1 Tax=Dissostichus mawsoni TaxID=36200 RepID=A0A7J5YX07_DISMA|nr:hypothetical protein F7725_006003 [Dissostichus mawsoni]
MGKRNRTDSMDPFSLKRPCRLTGRLPTNTVLFFFVTSSSFLFLFICLFITYCSASFPSLGSVFFFFAGPCSSSSAQCKLSSLKPTRKSKGTEERDGGYRLKEVALCFLLQLLLLLLAKLNFDFWSFLWLLCFFCDFRNRLQ